ncbi:MAG: sigma-70 family RNA polymerase sigma factor [Planctomycetota bacterium]
MSHCSETPLNRRIRLLVEQVVNAGGIDARTFALAELFDLTSDRLLRFSLSITRQRHDAEDAVSNAILKVADRPKVLAVASQPWHYLLQMVRNESLIIIRKRSRLRSLGEIAEKLIGKRGRLAIETEDEHKRIWQALKKLPTEQSEIIVLKFWEQMTFAEIGLLLQIQPATAASRYRYGMTKIAACLKRAGVQPDSITDRADSSGAIVR